MMGVAWSVLRLRSSSEEFSSSYEKTSGSTILPFSYSYFQICSRSAV